MTFWKLSKLISVTGLPRPPVPAKFLRASQSRTTEKSVDSIRRVVDTPKLRHRLGDCILDLLFLRNVGLNCEALVPGG